MKQADINEILQIGVLLSSERDFNRLLERILICAMELTNCDAGTLYLLDGDALRFKIMRNNTLKTFAGGDGQDPDLAPVPLSRENVCALALLDDRIIRIEDVKHCREYDFSGPIRYDSMTGYNTRSMLVIPMRNREREQIGVLQLINAIDENGQVCAFASDVVLAAESVASQAAITIQNVRYIEEIKELFHSFVRVMSSAVDERTPYNGGHTRRMAEYGSRFIDYLNSIEGRKTFSSAQKEELLMSVWLHDIGKLVTPLEVMNKMSRLLPMQYTGFVHRMELFRLKSEIKLLKNLITEEEKAELDRQTCQALHLVDSINGVGYVSDEMLQKLDNLRQKSFFDDAGVQHPWLTPEEYAMLSIRKGTLSEEERAVMEEHVAITKRLLSQIQFSRELSRVPEWAAAHHELLNGSGYPDHLTADQIPCEVRIITILDVFDALVADDRPYKPGMPVERALSILESMADQEGKLDSELTRLFLESRCWEKSEK